MFSSILSTEMFDLFEQLPSYKNASERYSSDLHYLDTYCSDMKVFWSHSRVQQIFLHLTFASLIKNTVNDTNRIGST